MRALVTGGTGFLGRNIVKRLLEGGVRVRTLSRRNDAALESLGVEALIGDIRNRKQVLRACDGVDTVFHVAACVGLWGAWDDFFQVNVLGTRNVIFACQAKSVSRLIYTSSPSVVFGGSPLVRADEQTPYPERYNSYYPWTKAIAEREVIAANGQGTLSTTSLRPHLIWGPRDTHLVPSMIERAKAGRLSIVGDATNVVDFTYVENVAQAHVLAARSLEESSAAAGKCYFISQDEPINLWEFVRRVLDCAGLSFPSRRISLKTAYALGAVLETAYRFCPLRGEPRITRFLAEQLALTHYFDISAARRDFGYSPEVNMEEGFRRLRAALGGTSGPISMRMNTAQ